MSAKDMAINILNMMDEERTYFSDKLQKAEVFDEVHKETYLLDDIINKHREKYRI